MTLRDEDEFEALSENFERQTVSIVGHHPNLPDIAKNVDVFKLPGDEAAPASVVIFPGNPGIGEYYFSFAEQFQKGTKEVFGSRCNVYTASYRSFPSSERGFSNCANSDMLNEHCDIRDEHNSFRRVLEFVLQQDGHKKLIVFGHSIGAWVLLRALALDGGRLADHLHLGVLGMPFLETDSSLFQTVVPKLFRWAPWFIVLVARFMAAAPRWVQQFIIRMNGGMDGWCRVVSLRYFAKYFKYLMAVRNLYVTENEALHPLTESGITDLEKWGRPRPLSVRDVVERSKQNLLAIYCPGDHWAPMHHKDRLVKAGLEAKVVKDVCHGFVVQSEQSQRVATVIISFRKQ